MLKAMLVAQYLRSCAWWRLDSAGADALQVARSVVALLDASAYLHGLDESDPDLTALAEAGCFSGAGFDPGPEGAAIVRGWRLTSESPAGPRDLLAALVQAAGRLPAARGGDGASAPDGVPAAARSFAKPPQTA